MAKPNKRHLIAAALEARQRAVAPYSQFQVGAALLTRTGEIIVGANVESASYGLTCCAERIALFKALIDGKKSFRAIAVESGFVSRERLEDAGPDTLLSDLTDTAAVLAAMDL